MNAPNSDYPPTHADKLTFCRLLANLITTDRKVTVQEREQLGALIMDVGLSPFDEDVNTIVNQELEKPAPIEEIAKLIQHPGLKVLAYRSLIEVALSDGLVRVEDEQLMKVAQVFGFKESAAREVLHLVQEELKAQQKLEAALLKL